MEKNIPLKPISGFYVALADIIVEPFWVEFLQENINTKMIYPPILRLKLNKGELVLENGAYDLVKDYSNDFIEFIGDCI